MKCWRQLLGNKLCVVPEHFSGFPGLRQAELRLMMMNALADQCPVQCQKWLSECVRLSARTVVIPLMKFWDVYGRMYEGSDLISGRTHGCSTMTMCQPMLPSWLDGFWPITTWLWCHILSTRPTLHPATFSYFQSWKWSLRGEDFRRWRKFKQSCRPSWTRTRKWLPGMLQKLAAPLGSLSNLGRGLLWRWCRPLMSKVSLFVF